MNMSWSSEGDLKFVILGKGGHQLKYVEKDITHIPGTLRRMPSGVLNLLEKIT